MIDFDSIPAKDAEFARKHIAKPHRKQQGRGVNKTEQAFEDVLQAAQLLYEIVGYERCKEPLKLAGNTTYLPDYKVAELERCEMTYVEIKGYMRDDAAVKIKVAAMLFPHFRFLLVRLVRGQWIVREVSGQKGIGRKAIKVPWIGG